MNTNALWGLISATFLLANSHGYAAHPKQNDGPSLNATMKFVQDKLAEQGSMRFTERFPNGSWMDVDKITNYLVMQHDNCAFEYRRFDWGGGLQNESIIVNLKDVKKVAIFPIQELANDGTPSAEPHPVNPQLFAMVGRIDATNYFEFTFRDDDDANRVAKALVHAIELCGGGNEPF